MSSRMETGKKEVRLFYGMYTLLFSCCIPLSLSTTVRIYMHPIGWWGTLWGRWQRWWSGCWGDTRRLGLHRWYTGATGKSTFTANNTSCIPVKTRRYRQCRPPRHSKYQWREYSNRRCGGWNIRTCATGQSNEERRCHHYQRRIYWMRYKVWRLQICLRHSQIECEKCKTKGRRWKN